MIDPNLPPSGSTPAAMGVDGAIYSLYEAALNADRWTSALESVAALSMSVGAVIFAKAKEGWTFPSHSAGIADAVNSYRHEEWSRRNPWLEGRLPAGFHAGDVYTEQDILDFSELSLNAFYRDFLSRFDISHVMASIIHSELGSPTSLVVCRAGSVGPFGDEDREALLLLARHLEQSLRITSAYLKAKATGDTVAQAFDRMDQPAVILDGKMRPLRVNRSAEPLLDRYFVDSDEGLRPTMRADVDDFVSTVQRAQTDGRLDGRLPHPATVSDPEGKKRLVVWTAPLVGTSADALGLVSPEKHVLMLAKDLENDQIIDPTVIRKVFGLTTGEARLASLIASGQSVREAAGELDISEGTARFVLKRIFAKLGVSRQAELVSRLRRLLLR
ncbi:DNA-binding CsgD family transcriptional regulator [Angulomicrobium tetraedrale]|uniref:DNA-binding CsgD family transcriptional regulator n=1 Tax=Ancylobacter tetraedralis TaxID=217068 RepID=A0A839ZDB7_9HYPH|nr:helix-turn-helix transcriptional regulator [Ancylobacter tetraedralis]MBB3772734.1 DNA-binding CsgD family transcriptional regulator [Ancylobacter tetraedralis]